MTKVTIDRALIEQAIAGAIFDFAGYLTSHPDTIEVGSVANAAVMVERIRAWAGYSGLSIENANVEKWNATLAEPAVEPVPPPSDFDDAAVDRFAEALKTKMRASREKGRSGWHDSRICSGQSLQKMLVEHLAKGDPVDVGNFAMMLWNRGEPTTATLAAVEPVAWLYDFTIVGDNEVYTNWVTQDPTEVGKEVEGISNVRPLYTSPPPPAEPAQSAMRVVGQCPETNEQCQSNCDTPCTVKPVPLLSDEEMWQLWNAQGDDAMDQVAAIAFARAIEQLVRRKAGLK